MRLANYKNDVLYAVAIKAGLDPVNKELLKDEAAAMAKFITEWVRRLWDNSDWPEWTLLKEFQPDAGHYVSYDAYPVGVQSGPQIGRPLRVYLLDPELVGGPVDTPHRLLDRGIHVGYDHGATVFIKFVPRAPQFTSEPWNDATKYGRGQLAYSEANGECYRSKTYNNQGNDPTFMLSGELTTVLTEPGTPPNPGIPPRPKRMVIGLKGVQPGPDPSDPPLNGSKWQIDIWEHPATNGAPPLLISATHTADGTESLATILTDLRNQLNTALAPLGFIVTAAAPALTITLEHASQFVVGVATYLQGGPLAGASIILRKLKVSQAQAYQPGTDPTPGTRRVFTVTITEANVRAGVVYTLDFLDGDGVTHSVSYQAQFTDSRPQVLDGLVQAIENAPDDFFSDVFPATNADLGTLILSLGNIRVSLSATYAVDNSIYWEHMLFPLALVDAVVRGAYADYQKSEGQTDKGMAEEQGALVETSFSTAKALAPAQDTLTDQQRRVPRYSNAPAAPPPGS